MNTMMKDNDLKRNASGYYDEPCYKTVTAPPKPGEIWKHGPTGAYMLVIASAGTVYSTLRLTDVEHEGNIKVMCKTPMYTRPIMIGYSFEDVLTEYVKAVKEEEFTAVKKAVGKALGIEGNGQASPIAYDLEDKVKALTDENEGLKKSYKDIFKENETLRSGMEIKAMAEKAMDEAYCDMKDELAKANVYKEMYIELLDKLISAKAVQ